MSYITIGSINCFEYLGFYFQIVVPASKVIKRTLENEHNWANVGFFFNFKQGVVFLQLQRYANRSITTAASLIYFHLVDLASCTFYKVQDTYRTFFARPMQERHRMVVPFEFKFIYYCAVMTADCTIHTSSQSSMILGPIVNEQLPQFLVKLLKVFSAEKTEPTIRSCSLQRDMLESAIDDII